MYLLENLVEEAGIPIDAVILENDLSIYSALFQSITIYRIFKDVHINVRTPVRWLVLPVWAGLRTAAGAGGAARACWRSCRRWPAPGRSSPRAPPAPPPPSCCGTPAHPATRNLLELETNLRKNFHFHNHRQLG